jgi:2-polyprenyl-6-methoxyphenol hydroxylase-like FAD-dependent oxidoreductase
VAVLRQDELERVFETALRKAGVAVQWNHEAAQLRPHDDHVSVQLDRYEQDTVGYSVEHTEWVLTKSREEAFSFVVGADGHSSLVRRALSVGFPQVGETQDFAVFEFRSDADLDHEMKLTLRETDTNVLWPLAGGYCRWSFEVPPRDPEADTRAKDRDVVMPGEGEERELTATHLRELIRVRAPWFAGTVDAIRWSMFVRFERRLADSFGLGRMWLVGDAAHLTGPAGVQSMNVGLREADDLAARLADVLRGRAPMSSLDEYGGQRRDEWRQLLGLDGGPQTSPTTAPWIASCRQRLLPCIPATGADLGRLATQIGLVTKPAASATGLRSGTWAPSDS